MKDEPQHRHKEAASTVIHHYDEDETVLERWFRQGLEKGVSFWLLVGGVIVLAVVVMLLVNSWTSRRSETAQAWLEVMVPSTVADTGDEGSNKGLPDEVRPLLKVAEDHPNTPAADWALYQAACYLYQDGLRDLPNNRDAAKPILKQSYEYFERVTKSADKDSPLRRFALMGMARALEARGELSEAREEYQQVASNWPDSEIASQAKERAALLDKPEVKKFYEEFYSQDFSRFTSGSGLSTSDGDSLGLPPGHPPIGTSDLGLPRALPPDLGTEPTGLPPSPAQPARSATGLPELPDEIFAPGSATSPATELEAPATEPETKGELPSNPFAPGGSADRSEGSETPKGP